MTIKRPRYRMVTEPAAKLRIHPKAQRELLPSKLKKLVAGMDLDAIGVVHAVEYAIDNVKALWVIDGQHRVRSLIDLNMGDWPVEVKVHLDADNDERACALFLKLNDRASVRPWDKFQAGVGAKDPVPLGVVAIVERHKVRLAAGSQDGAASCVMALQKIFRIDQGISLDRSLAIALRSWGRKSSAMDAVVLEGLAAICSKYNGQLNEAVLVKKLAKHPGGAAGLVGDARGLSRLRRGPVVQCAVEIIHGLYNSGRSSGRLA